MLNILLLLSGEAGARKLALLIEKGWAELGQVLLLINDMLSLIFIGEVLLLSMKINDKS